MSSATSLWWSKHQTESEKHERETRQRKQKMKRKKSDMNNKCNVKIYEEHICNTNK
jgi:hypothetical protein